MLTVNGTHQQGNCCNLQQKMDCGFVPYYWKQFAISLYQTTKPELLQHTSALMILTSPTGGVESFTTGTIVGIAVSIASVFAFITGALAGILVYYCISKHQCHQSSKPEPSSHQQQEVMSSNPLQQTDPEYAEVIKLRQNKAYELTKTRIEIRANQPT